MIVYLAIRWSSLEVVLMRIDRSTLDCSMPKRGKSILVECLHSRDDKKELKPAVGSDLGDPECLCSLTLSLNDLFTLSICLFPSYSLCQS